MYGEIPHAQEEGNMIKVTIDGQLFAEAIEIPNNWNGFAEPIFTFKEMNYIQSECSNLGWDILLEDGEAFAVVV